MQTRTLAYLSIGGVVVTVAIYAAILLSATWPIDEYSLDRSGLFGDSFGIVTCLFSGLAFAGMIITITMQRSELALQRQELAMTREELAKAGEAQAEQVREMRDASYLNALSTLASCYTQISLTGEAISGIPKRASFEHRDIYLKILESQLAEYSVGTAEEVSLS